MEFGIAFANTGPYLPRRARPPSARPPRTAGFESLWTVEHVLVPAGYQSEYPYDPSGKMPGGETSDIPDPLIWLTYVAAHTTPLNLGTGILILPQRNPVVLAKECATLDRLSGGRVELGIGVGWLEEEFDALGVPFAERGARTDEYIAALRALWTEREATHHGQFTNFDRRHQPAHAGRRRHPDLVGGHSKVAARRAGRLGDGFFPGKGSHEELPELFEVMREQRQGARPRPRRHRADRRRRRRLRPRRARRGRRAGRHRRHPRRHPAAHLQPHQDRRPAGPVRRERHRQGQRLTPDA